jgi:hypothetical protein
MATFGAGVSSIRSTCYIYVLNTKENLAPYNSVRIIARRTIIPFLRIVQNNQSLTGYMGPAAVSSVAMRAAALKWDAFL